MKIQYASDLHLEFRDNSRYINEIGLEPAGDILLLAGDIIYLENKRMEAHPFFDWCSGHYRQTIIVPGNHEYYRDPYAKGYLKPYKNLADTLDSYEHNLRENVRYINNKSIVFDDIEIFSTTLWTITDPLNYVGIQTGMNDCHQIVFGDHKLWADDYTEVHQKCRNWLDSALRSSNARGKIVLTHHCPISRKEFDTHAVGSGLWSAFHVDMEEFIRAHDIDCWIYGHTHLQDGSGTRFESAVSGKETTVLCNQLGYVQCGEQENFNSVAFLEI